VNNWITDHWNQGICVSTKVIISETRRWVVTYSITNFVETDSLVLQMYEKKHVLWNRRQLWSILRNVGSLMPIMVLKIMHCLMNMKVRTVTVVTMTVIVVVKILKDSVTVETSYCIAFIGNKHLWIWASDVNKIFCP